MRKNLFKILAGLFFALLSSAALAEPFRVDPSMTQEEINRALAKNPEVVFAPGVYRVDVLKSYLPTSNQTITLEKGAELRAIPTDKHTSAIFRLNDLVNVTIEGGLLVGEREGHLGDKGEWGHGIATRDCEMITIRNVTVRDCWGDGIYLGATPTGYNDGVTVTGCLLDNNRRQGISVISAINSTIENTRILNTHGTNPGAGIDFEPNNDTQRLENLLVRDVYTYNTMGPGIVVSPRPKKLPYTEVTIENHKHECGERGNVGLQVNVDKSYQKVKVVSRNFEYVNVNTQ